MGQTPAAAGAERMRARLLGEQLSGHLIAVGPATMPCALPPAAAVAGEFIRFALRRAARLLVPLVRTRSAY